MDGIGIGDWYLIPGDLIVVLLFIGAAIAVLVATYKRYREHIDDLLFSEYQRNLVWKFITLLVVNLPLYLLRKTYQQAANNHLEPISGYLLALLFILLAVSIIGKAVLLGPRLLRNPWAFAWCHMVAGALCFWAYQYLSVDCELCSKGV